MMNLVEPVIMVGIAPISGLDQVAAEKAAFITPAIKPDWLPRGFNPIRDQAVYDLVEKADRLMHHIIPRIPGR